MPFGSVFLAVIVSAVAVFIGSSVIHMALKYHRADVTPLPGEEAIREALGKSGAAPGFYVTPYCSDHKQMKEPAMVEKYQKGPIAMITVLPNGAPAMGKYLGLWFLFTVLVSFVCGYVARVTLHPGADGMTVMRVTGTVAFAAYGLSHVSDSIWKAQPWGNTLRALLDALIYCLITAFVFKALWPAA